MRIHGKCYFIKTYHIITYGCQMNRSDSERVESVLSSFGLSHVEKSEEADVIVVNACSVRQSAINRIWGDLEHFEKWKKGRPFVTILTGCVLPSDKPKFETRFDAVIPIKEIAKLPDILSSIKTSPHVIPNPDLGSKKENKRKQDVIASRPRHLMSRGGVAISFKEKNEIASSQTSRNDNSFSVDFSFLDSVSKHGMTNESEPSSAAEKLSHTSPPTLPFNYFTNQPLSPISQNTVSNTYLNLRPKHLSKFSAFVPIMTGCNAFCTYCAVPYTRGAEENRKPEEIIQEVEDLVMNKNYKEITLLGQIINKYNVRADDPFLKFLEWYQAKHSNTLSFLEDLKASEKRIFKFHHLLETLGKLPRKFWLRFTSSHPNWFTDELITTIRDTPNIPKHLHLPVQAGSDAVLLRMRRPYKIAQYLDFIKKIRERIPLATITTDCIVGFPGETEEEFKESLAVFETVRYDMAFTAQYSPRPDTFAYKNLKDDIPHSVKADREKRLNEILKRTALENNQRLVGLTFDVLIHGKKSDNLYHGISENFKNVHVESDQDLPIGEFVPVTFTEANPWSLKGKNSINESRGVLQYAPTKNARANAVKTSSPEYIPRPWSCQSVHY